MSQEQAVRVGGSDSRILWVGIAAVVIALAAAGSASAAFPGKPGKVAFTRLMKNGTADIFLMNPNTTKQRNLTKTPRSNEYNASWSPDGKRIVFESDRDSKAKPVSKLYIMALTKRQLVAKEKKPQTTRLTKGKGADQVGRFCKKNTVIFVRTIGNRKGDLYLVNTKTKRVTRLTKTAVHEGTPVCSADGKWVYYTLEGSQPGDFSVVRQRLRKNKLRGAAQILAKGDSPDVSPDGTLVAYAGSDPVDFSREIFVLDLTQPGAEAVQITFGDFRIINGRPKFTPDSRRSSARSTAGALDRVALWLSRTKILEDRVENVVVRWSSAASRTSQTLSGGSEIDGEDGEEGSDDD